MKQAPEAAEFAIRTANDALVRGELRASFAATVRAAYTFGESVRYLPTGHLAQVSVGRGHLKMPKTEPWVSVWVECTARAVALLAQEARTSAGDPSAPDPSDDNVLAGLIALAPRREDVLATYRVGGVEAAVTLAAALLRNPGG